MLMSYKRGQGSIVLRCKILNSSVATGAGLTGLTSASSGLIISTIADNEASATAYTVAGSTIESIATLGTYAAPTATKCRFKEVDATNHKGVFEIQFADARYAVSGAKSLLVSISGPTNCAETDFVVPLTDMDPYDAVHGGMSAIPNTACTTNGSLLTSGTGTAQLSTSSGQVILQAGTGTGQLDFTSGIVKANATQWLGGTIPAVNVTGVPKVDIVDWLGTAPLALSSQQVQAVVPITQKVDLNTIKTQTITCAAGVTVGVYVGQGTAAIAVDGSGRVTAGTVSDKTGYSLSGTTTTLDALQTALNSAHGSGSWATATGFSTLDAAGVRSAVGLGAANMDTQFNAIYTVAGLVQAKTDNIPLIPATEANVTTVGTAVSGVYTRIGSPSGASDISGMIVGVKTDTTSILSRIGAFAGSGVNTVLGFFKALLSKTATVPSDVGGTFDPSADSTEAIRDHLGTPVNGSGTIADAIDTACSEANAAHNIVASGTYGNEALVGYIDSKIPFRLLMTSEGDGAGSVWARDNSGNTLATSSSLSDLATTAGLIKTQTDHLGSTLVFVSGSTYRFTSAALALGPIGSTNLMPVSGSVTIGNVIEGGKIVGQFGSPLSGLTVSCTTTTAGVTSDRDLTAYSGSLAFVVYDNDETAAVHERIVSGADITVAGNVATLSSTATYVLNSIVGDNLRWALREDTVAPSLVFAKGPYVCQRMPLSR